MFHIPQLYVVIYTVHKRPWFGPIYHANIAKQSRTLGIHNDYITFLWGNTVSYLVITIVIWAVLKQKNNPQNPLLRIPGFHSSYPDIHIILFRIQTLLPTPPVYQIIIPRFYAFATKMKIVVTKKRYSKISTRDSFYLLSD